jgi:uncharacterized membrane protein YgdD (TMEM256/DUF423 family)
MTSTRDSEAASRASAWTLLAGSLLAALGVAAGAFGAHGLEGRVVPDRLAVYETAARYHIYHALALVLVAALLRQRVRRALVAAAWLFGAGVVIFSGSLYALVLTDTPQLGAVTPLGGAAFIAGWGAVAWSAWTSAVRRR